MSYKKSSKSKKLDSLKELTKIEAEKKAEKDAELEEQRAKYVHEFEIVGEPTEDKYDDDLKDDELFKVQHYLEDIGIQKDEDMKVLPYECYISHYDHDFFK